MPQSKQLFTNRDTWHGGYYERAIELGERSDERLESALLRLWGFPSLEGCYLERNSEPRAQVRVEPSLSRAERGHLLGIAQMPNGRRIACGTLLYREEGGPDWLTFYLPMGALAQAYPVKAFPFDADEKYHEKWRPRVDAGLADLGSYVFEAVRYPLGLIGHEVLAEASAKDIDMKGGIPDERYFGYLWPYAGTLQYFPPTAA